MTNGFIPKFFKYNDSFFDVVVFPELDGPAISTSFSSSIFVFISYAIVCRSSFCLISFSCMNSFIFPFIIMLFTSDT